MGRGKEEDYLRKRNDFTEVEEIQEFVDLQSQGMSLKQIAEATGFSKTTIHRKLKKAAEMGIVPTVKTDDTATPEPFRSNLETEPVERGGTPAKLPFKDDE